MEKILEKLSRFFGPYQVGVLDADRETLWKVSPELKCIPYLKAENASGRHVFMQPMDETCFLMADDLAWERVEQDHKVDDRWRPGRMCVETSPNNYQVWIHCNRALSVDEKRYWLERLGSDPDAGPRGRWGRMPGFRNRKDKYQNDAGWPLAKLIWVDYSNTATIPGISGLSHSTPKAGAVPSVPLTHSDIHRSLYDRGNESKTDFAYALALIRRGVSDSEVRGRIIQERQNWEHHRNRERYVDRTVQKARAAVSG